MPRGRRAAERVILGLFPVGASRIDATTRHDPSWRPVAERGRTGTR